MQYEECTYSYNGVLDTAVYAPILTIYMYMYMPCQIMSFIRHAIPDGPVILYIFI